MKEPKFDVTRSIAEYFADRRTFLGKAGAVSLGAVLTALGMPESAAAFPSVSPPSSYSTLLGLCTPGTATTTYTPGLTNTLQPIHLSSNITFAPCAVAQNKVVTGYHYAYDMIASCSAITDFTGWGTIFYSSGQNSVWTIESWTITWLLGQSIGVVSGLVTNGPFNGARVWSFFIRAVTDPALCATAGGLTGSTGTNTLIIAEP